MSHSLRSLLLLFAVLSVSLVVTACSDDDGAGTGIKIETGKGLGEVCSSDVNCRDGLGCVDGTCSPTGSSGPGTACQLSAECTEGFFCALDPALSPVDPTIRYICQESGEASLGDGCVSTADCTSGLICLPDGFSMKCQETGSVDVGGACTETTDCIAGPVCVDGTCTNPRVWTPIETWDSPTCTVYDAPARALFDVPRTQGEGDFYALPFPNDIRTRGGHPDLMGHRTPPLTGFSGPIVQRYLDVIASDLDGFAQNPTIIFRFSVPVDLATLRDETDTLRAIIYDLSGPDDEGMWRRHAVSWAAAAGPGSGGQYMCDNWLALQVPWGRPLSPGRTYAAVLRKGVATEAGVAVSRAPDLDAMLADSAPSDAALATAWNAYAPLRDLIAAGEISGDEILNATVFTTQTGETLVPAMREAVRATDAPTLDQIALCDAAGAASPCDDGLTDELHTRGCIDEPNAAFHELQARVSIPTFQTGTAPYETFDDGGGIALDAGRPQVQGQDEVCVSMTVPTQAPMPEDGWPLIIYAHGSGGDYRQAVARGFAELAATLEHDSMPAGAVVLGFDAVVHGDRKGDSTVESKELYFNYANPPAARGHVFQGTADLFQLARLAESGWMLDAQSSPTGEEIRFDPTKVILVGHSQGTHYGTLVLPYEPNYMGAVLSGAGGGLTRGTLEKTQPVNIAAGVRAALADFNVGEYHPALALVQMYFDAVDPIVHAESVLYLPEPQREVRPHLFHLIGIGDTYSPDQTQRDLAVGLGAVLIDDGRNDVFGGVNTTMLPVEGPNFGAVTAVARQYAPDGPYDGHHVAQNHPEALDDLREFLSSVIATGNAVIPD